MIYLFVIKNFLKNFFGLIFRDRLIQVAFSISLTINLFLWILLYFTFFPLREFGDLVPLHYSIYFGIDLVGRWYKIFTLPFVGIFILFINLILSCSFYLKEKMISYFLSIATLFSQILLTIAGITVILISR